MKALIPESVDDLRAVDQRAQAVNLSALAKGALG